MDSKPETELWIVCPICLELSPQGTTFCAHCWGPILRGEIAVAYDQARAISHQKLTRALIRKKMKIAILGLIPLVGIFLGLYFKTDLLTPPNPSLNSNSLSGDWAMFRHDVSHSGTIAASNAVPQGTIQWTFATGAAINASPAVAGNVVYFGSTDHKFYALDATTGNKLWEYQTDSWIESSPAIANGVVYFGSNDGNLYALDSRNGTKLWDFKTDYPIRSSPAVANGILYVGADDYNIYALDAATGKQLWRFDTHGPVESSPVIANGILYIGSGDTLYALNAQNGRFRLGFKAYQPIISSPTVIGKTVYFTNSKGALLSINGNARSRPAEHDLKPFWLQIYYFGLPVPAPPPETGLLWGVALGKSTTSSPTIANNTLYVGADDKLVALDLLGRQKRWEFATGDLVTSSPALMGQTIIVGSHDGQLYAIDASNGNKLWGISTGGRITSSPAIANGTIYVSSKDGKLYAIK